jgi:EpsI family protein
MTPASSKSFETTSPDPKNLLASLGLLPLRVLIVALLVAATVGVCIKASDLNSSAEAGVLTDLPKQVGNFFGTSEEISEAEKQILPGDTVIVRKTYENFQGDRISCSIVLAGGEKRSIHRPEICLPSQGWTIGSGRTVPVPLQSGRTLDVMQLNLSRPIEVQPNVFRPIRSQFFYWFVGKNITTPDHKVRILRTSWDRVFNRVNHRWAYIIVSSVVTDTIRSGGLNSEQTEKMLKDFIAEIVPTFQKSEMPQ